MPWFKGCAGGIFPLDLALRFEPALPAFEQDWQESLCSGAQAAYVRVAMNTVLLLFLIAAMIATVVALIRGVIAFLKTTEEDLKNAGEGPSVSSQKQNKAMMQRVMFQALAIVIVVVMLFAARG